MNTLFQNYLITFVLNPGFEKQLGKISDILQSGIQYGYSPDIDEHLKYIADEYEYRILQERRVMCVDHCQCLEHMLKKVDFACVSNTFCALVLIQSRASNYSRRDVCVLPKDIYRMRGTMYLKKGHPLLRHFNKIIRRMIEAGLVSKWKNDFISKQKPVTSSLSYGKDIIDTKNIVVDNMYEEGYVALSRTHLTVVFHILLLGCSLSLTVFIVEIVYRSLLGHT